MSFKEVEVVIGGMPHTIQVNSDDPHTQTFVPSAREKSAPAPENKAAKRPANKAAKPATKSADVDDASDPDASE